MVRYLVLLSVIACFSSPARAQVVILPTQQQFSYRGSVLVPDGGSTYLGGNRRYATGSSHRGWGPFNRSQGSEVGAGGLSISATIIDHQEIDRQLLGGTPQEFMAQVRRQRDGEQRVSEAASLSALEEGKALVRYARQLYAEGEIERSKRAYRMALPLLSAPLRALAAAEYSRVVGLPR